MALEELSLSSGVGVVAVDGVPTVNGGGGDELSGSKAPRLPRWTRHEILVLIQGKRVAENRVRRGRTAALAHDSGQPEPKWASVSSYCRRHGVNRGPVQCRKRWSNLAGDFKKIKEWENQVKEDSESFWVMRNDLRRERKLPGFFDKEVYDILDGTATPPPMTPGLDLTLTDPAIPSEEPVVEAEAEALFDSGRSAAAEDGLFSDFEQSGQEGEDKETPEKERDVSTRIPNPVPISEKQYQPFAEGVAGQGTNEKQPARSPEIGSTSHQRKKRKLQCDAAVDVETETGNGVQDHLIQVLEKSGRILGAHLEAQNTNLKLDREERKEHANSLVAVLNKLADALGRIADKL